ncbi:hypothetical protein HK100_012825, partial [Physocladia obscura]
GVDAWYGLSRIGEFLLAAELRDESVRLTASADPQEPALEIKDGHFAWQTLPDDTLASQKSPASFFKLKNVQISIPRGKLVAIVGKVGSGKSSLLGAFVGEMSRLSGSIVFRGSVAYCQQASWIQNTTVKENILFGRPFDDARYKHVVRVCSLERDFEILPNGDETEIGERGINLSGGQKQRVQIARAVYYDPDIILLDDPLSAVDAHVGRALFEDCILGELAGKTRVLVTHQLQYLPQVDSIILMNGGALVAQGSFDELLKSNKDFANLMQDFGGHKSENDQQDIDRGEGKKLTGESLEGVLGGGERVKKSLLIAEERNEGAVKLKYYGKYLHYCGGLFAGVCLFAVVLFSQSSRVMGDEWLTYWTNQKFQWLSLHQYIGIYVGITLLMMGLSVMYGVTIAYFGTIACWNMHGYALGSVLNSPLSFFDATPLGRLTSRYSFLLIIFKNAQQIYRFSRDFDAIDNQLVILIYQVGYTSATAISNFILISTAIPAFLIPLVFMLAGYYALQVYYRTTALELKRLDSISRSPLLANVSESISGISTIRAYGAINRFMDKNCRLLDNNNRAYYLSLLIQRWIQLRVEALNAFLLLATVIFVILFDSSLSSGLAGLVLVYIVQATSMLSSLVSMSASLEINMNSAERVIYYIDELEKENEGGSGSFLVSGCNALKPDILDLEWPHAGRVEVSDLVLRYRPDLPPVLHGVSFSVKAGDKIGIVGRTGAGKSSILTCILRLFEIECGSIVIDGVDIKNIGLTDLRHRIGVIPQEPVLFSGTVRSNLDPFNKYKDVDLWDALERAGLKETVSLSVGGLDSIVTENGENWSTGQRQLICLARAILKNAKILLLDEATASVDLATDEFIQKAIRSNFTKSTVMTIAHRLNTIADYDKILVMGAGKVIEFGKPADLLSDEESHFSKMVAETGPNNAASIKELASKIPPVIPPHPLSK